MSNAKAANSKYLTYKEWKLFGFRDLTYFITLVSTLPIRNGNITQQTVPLFTEYSREYLTYKEWKLTLYRVWVVKD